MVSQLVTTIRNRNWFFMIFFLFFGSLFLGNELDQFYRLSQLRLNGVNTTATVVEVVKIKLIEREVVEFTVSTGEKINAMLPVGRYIRLGEIVNIVYDLRNPTNVSLADFSHHPAAGLVALLSYLFVLLELLWGFTNHIKSE